MTQCGLPIETQVRLEVVARQVGTFIGGLPVSVVGILLASRIGSPMSTRTWRTLPSAPTSSSSVSTPRPVSMVSARFSADAVIVDELGHAANAVAAHLRFAAVGVEHAHAGVGRSDGTDQDQPIAADAEMPVADCLRQAGRVGAASVGGSNRRKRSRCRRLAFW